MTDFYTNPRIVDYKQWGSHNLYHWCVTAPIMREVKSHSVDQIYEWPTHSTKTIFVTHVDFLTNGKLQLHWTCVKYPIYGKDSCYKVGDTPCQWMADLWNKSYVFLKGYFEPKPIIQFQYNRKVGTCILTRYVISKMM